jgi:hypothetical protein
MESDIADQTLAQAAELIGFTSEEINMVIS